MPMVNDKETYKALFQMTFNIIYSVFNLLVSFVWPDIGVRGPASLQVLAVILQSCCWQDNNKQTYSKRW